MTDSNLTPGLDAEASRRVAPYVTNVDRPVFALRNLPPEVCAYLFARYSRSREGVREMLVRMLDDSDAIFGGHTPVEETGAELEAALSKARAFAEKWIAGYGHKSPAEDAPIHVCYEGASVLFSKVIEDFRLTSPQEKSTRYVVFSRDTLYRPRFEGPRGNETSERAAAHLDRLMAAYAEQVEAVRERCRLEYPRDPDQSERGYETLITTKACDLCRYLLPTAVLTNVGVFANAREWEYVISRLLSHPLAEARAMGEATLGEAVMIAPTLIRYARPVDYYRQAPARLREIAEGLGSPVRPPADRVESEPVRIHSYESDAEVHLCAAMLYPQSGRPYQTLIAELSGSDAEPMRQRILAAALEGCGPYDTPIRAVENTTYRIEFCCDYGAYRDLQRHRMGTSIDPLLTPDLGYSLPDEIVDWGMDRPFRQAFEESRETWESIVGATGDRLQAQYLLPFMTRYRFFRVWNLRQVMNVIRVRSAREGHTSYRRVAQALYHEVRRVHPLLAVYIQVDLGEYSLARHGSRATK